MVKYKSIPLVGPFETIADYEDMKAEMKRVKTLISEFESGLLTQVGKEGGNIRFSDGLLEVTRFGEGEGRSNTKYKEAWLDLSSMIESSAVWQMSKEEMLKTLQAIFDMNTNRANLNQRILVKKDVKTVKAKTVKV